MLIHQFFLDPKDGGGSRFNQFTKYWRQAGNQITVITGTVHYATGRKPPEYRGKLFVHQVLDNGVSVIHTHVSKAYNRSFLGRFWAYLSFAFSSTLAGLLSPRPDVIIATSPPLSVGITGCILSRCKRAPLVFEVRDLWPDSAIATSVLTNPFLIKFSYWLENLCYRTAKKINVLIPEMERVLVDKKGVPPDKVVSIPNGADLDLLFPGPQDNWVRAKYGLQGKFVVTYLGAHGVANNLITLVEAADALRNMADIHFLLVGDGMQRPFLQEKARSLGLTNITFVPMQPKSTMADFCNASDVCTVVLKRLDIFKMALPNKLFDYMTCAKPIIIGIDGTARQLVVEQAQAGVYVPPEDSAALAKAVLSLRGDQELRTRLGINGRLYVEREFSREELAKKYLEIIRNIV